LIIDESQKSVEVEQKEKNKHRTDTVSRIFELLKILCNYNKDKKIDV